MMKLNSRALTRTSLAALACAGLAFGCADNGRDSGVRDDARTSDTYSGSTSSANDTYSGTTAAAPATGNTATGAATGAGTTAPAAGTTGATTTTTTTTTGTGTAGTDTHAGHHDETPAAGTKMANAKKKAAKKADKMEKKAEEKKPDSSMNDDMNRSGNLGAYDGVNEEDENMRDEAGTEIGDTTSASTSNPEEDSTVSGTTSNPSDANASTTPSSTSNTTTMSSNEGTQSVSTSSASDEDLKAAARMAGSISPWYTEPYSRIPTHVGSTTITGKDKSVAALEGYSDFIDPAALERSIHGRDAVRPVSEIDFNSFGYDKRMRFTSQMNARLENIDSRLDLIEAKNPSSNEITTIHSDHMALENQLDDVRKVDESQWSSFRDSFRDRLTALEREVARLSASR